MIYVVTILKVEIIINHTSAVVFQELDGEFIPYSASDSSLEERPYSEYAPPPPRSAASETLPPWLQQVHTPPHSLQLAEPRRLANAVIK